jgi:hypothetical protein
MENARQATTGDPAGGQDARTRVIEPVGFASTLGVDLSFDVATDPAVRPTAGLPALPRGWPLPRL